MASSHMYFFRPENPSSRGGIRLPTSSREKTTPVSQFPEFNSIWGKVNVYFKFFLIPNLVPLIDGGSSAKGVLAEYVSVDRVTPGVPTFPRDSFFPKIRQVPS